MTKWELRDWIEHIVPKYMRAGKMPGLSLAVVENGKTIYVEGFGSRDKERNLPATPDTLYGIGSITKSFVAIAVMKLVEKGLINLDDPVSMHVPLKIGLDGDPIRIHNLLTHSLGLPSLATSSVAFYKSVGYDTGIPFARAPRVDVFIIITQLGGFLVTLFKRRLVCLSTGTSRKM